MPDDRPLLKDNALTTHPNLIRPPKGVEYWEWDRFVKALNAQDIVDFEGATAPGIVPDPLTSDTTKFLRDDGVWAVPSVTVPDFGSEEQMWRGYVSSDGLTSQLPSGWSVVRNSTGNYTVTHSLGLASSADLSVVPGVVSVGGQANIQLESVGVNSFTVGTVASDANADRDWFFIAGRASTGIPADPNLDSLLFWNDTAGETQWIQTIPDSFIAVTSVTQHEAALTITESQISDLAHTTSIFQLTDVDADPNVDSIALWDDSIGTLDWITELPDGFLSSNVPLLNAANVFTAQRQTISHNSGGRLSLVDANASADEGTYEVGVNDNLFRLNTLTDALAFGAVALQVTRTGTTVDEIELNATALDFNGSVIDFGGGVFYTGIVTPAALSSGNNNNWNPGVTGVSRVNATANAAGSTITGMTGGLDGKIVIITNVGASGNITIPSESASSTAANRFRSNGSQTIPPGVSETYIYVGAISRWSCISSS